MNFRTALLQLYYRVRDSFDVLKLPGDYDHSESALPPDIDCRFIHISSSSGGIGNFRWVNPNPHQNSRPGEELFGPDDGLFFVCQVEFPTPQEAKDTKSFGLRMGRLTVCPRTV